MQGSTWLVRCLSLCPHCPLPFLLSAFMPSSHLPRTLSSPSPPPHTHTYRSGAPIDATDSSGETPLHLATRVGGPAAVAALLHKGAAVEALSTDQRTPLLHAIDAGAYLSLSRPLSRPPI